MKILSDVYSTIYNWCAELSIQLTKAIHGMIIYGMVVHIAYVYKRNRSDELALYNSIAPDELEIVYNSPAFKVGSTLTVKYNGVPVYELQYGDEHGVDVTRYNYGDWIYPFIEWNKQVKEQYKKDRFGRLE